MAQAPPPQFNGVDPNNLTAPNHLKAFNDRPTKFPTRLIRNGIAMGPYASILLSNPAVDPGDNKDWYPVKGLGAGSFGKVVHFERLNDLGESIDNVAIKQQHMDRHGRDMWHNPLIREAFFHSQLHTHDSAICVTDLRKYKAYPIERETRMYLEYASHGTLLDVTERYQLKHKFVPELFVWSVFEKLAEVAVLMQRCPGQWQPMFQDQPGNPNRNGRDPNSFILALDIKPENILLFDRDEVLGVEHPRLPRLPVVKLADFGMTKMFGQHVSARDVSLQAGTEGYIPPEIPPFIPRNNPPPRTGDNWNQPLYHQNLNIDETHNVWVIGKVIFDMMTHFRRESCQIHWAHLQEANYRFNLHFIPPIHLIPETVGLVKYAVALRDLVRECISMEPNQRPSSANLLARVRAGRVACIDSIRNRRGTGVRREDRLALTTAEFNKIRQADDLDLTLPYWGWAAGPRVLWWWDIWTRHRANKSLDPDEPLLDLDRTRYRDFYLKEDVQYSGRPPGRHNWQQAGGMAEIRQDPSKGRKRMGSWKKRDEPDDTMRQKLRDLRQRVPTAWKQPAELFLLVLRKQMMSVNRSAAILNWMFAGNNLDPGEDEWTIDPDIARKADKLKELMDGKLPQGLTRSARSARAVGPRESPMRNAFKYFVAQATPGNDQVNEAYEEMLAVYRT